MGDLRVPFSLPKFRDHLTMQFPEYEGFDARRAELVAQKLIERAAETGCWIANDLPERLAELRRIMRRRTAA